MGRSSGSSDFEDVDLASLDAVQGGEAQIIPFPRKRGIAVTAPIPGRPGATFHVLHPDRPFYNPS